MRSEQEIRERCMQNSDERDRLIREQTPDWVALAQATVTFRVLLWVLEEANSEE